MLRGIGLVIFIAALAGAIAYLGDRVGHQVGRKRLTLFGIRPRYTSTIVAIGTGVVIALIVTLSAIFASQEVKTAFFKIYSINQQITTLQAREKELETKVNNTQVVVPLDGLMTTRIARFPKGSSADLRKKIAQSFYADTVSAVDATYVPPLKPFVPPSNVDSLLGELADSPQVRAAVSKYDVFAIAVAERNLFVGDPIRFQIEAEVDKRAIASGQLIASIPIPAGKNVQIGLAMPQLLQRVVEALIVSYKLPPYFVGAPTVVRTYPSAREMQQMVTQGKGVFNFAAFAAEDIYPHTFVQTGTEPVVVVLTPAR